MCETIYIEKNKSSRFGIHFYENANQWKVFLHNCNIVEDKLAFLYYKKTENNVWKTLAEENAEHFFAISKPDEAILSGLRAFVDTHIKDYTFVVLAEACVLNAFRSILTSQDAKISFICVPVSSAAHFEGFSLRPKFDLDSNLICKEFLPKGVYVDLSTVKEATPGSFHTAITVAFRMAISYKVSMFEWMISNMYELTDMESEAVEELVKKGYEVLKERIEKDTIKERSIPLYGEAFYTFFRKNMQDISKTEAIALSLVAQTCASWKKELLTMDEFYEVRDMLVFFGLPITQTTVSPDEFMRILQEECNPWSEMAEDTYIRKVGKIISEEKPDKALLKVVMEQIYFDENANE